MANATLASRRQIVVSSIGQTVKRFFVFVSVACGCVATAVVAVVVVGLVAGWRPIVIQTGSMAPALPAGALAVAGPVDARQVAVGDIVVARRPGRPPVTHRVVEIVGDGAGLLAMMQGDANLTADAEPYGLGDRELVVTHSIRDGARILVLATNPMVPTTMVMLAIVVLSVVAFRGSFESEVSAERITHEVV